MILISLISMGLGNIICKGNSIGTFDKHRVWQSSLQKYRAKAFIFNGES